MPILLLWSCDTFLWGSNLVPLPAARGYHVMYGTERQKLVLGRELKLRSCSRMVGSHPSQEHIVWGLMWQLAPGHGVLIF